MSLSTLRKFGFARLQSTHSNPISLGTKEKNEEKLGSIGPDVLHHIGTAISVVICFHAVETGYFSNFSTKLTT